jgi:hypothetical protein
MRSSLRPRTHSANPLRVIEQRDRFSIRRAPPDRRHRQVTHKILCAVHLPLSPLDLTLAVVGISAEDQQRFDEAS